MKTIISLIIVLNVLFTQSINAEVKLPAIVSSHMVLQRNATIALWGWADANEKIIIETSWLNELLEVEADEEGNWSVDVKTTTDTGSQTIKITSKTSDITLDDVVFGEVWLCSGQSNMYQPLIGYKGQPTFGGNTAIARSENSKLRLFSVEKVASKEPLKDIEKFSGWQQANANNVANFSAVAYFFGQQLQEILNVPVGLIHTSWGGSKVQAWMSEEVLNEYQKVDLTGVDLSKKTNQIPTVLFNAMINPLIPYTIRGALWYQGESNRNEPNKYTELFPAMVNDWRTRWEIGDFPFYYVQIAPFSYRKDIDEFNNSRNTAFLREAQLQCLDLIPNSGIAITMDIGDKYCIHPPIKKEVADRLLLNALNQTYGYKGVDFAAPIFHSQKEKDGGILLKFRNVETGLYSYDKLGGFEIAGEDKVFYPAKAKIVNRKDVFVISKDVSNPVAVRYAWCNWIKGTLYDTNLLPASSFRTDKWTDATRAKK